MMKVTNNWKRVSEIYKRFADGDYDFSESAALSMFAYETHGTPLVDAQTNGFAAGKKWMDVTVAAWKEDLPRGLLFVSELQDDGYPDWFLEKVGVLVLADPKWVGDQKDRTAGNLLCPTCGYYCMGTGGAGCIKKKQWIKGTC